MGCLGIPYAFLQSGIILGVVLILLLSFVSYMTVMWIAVATQQVNFEIYVLIKNIRGRSNHTY